MRLSPVDGWLRKKTGLGSALTPETLRERQLERLRLQARWARQKSAFYGERLADVNLNLPMDEERLASLPFTFPAELRAAPNRFACLPQGEIARIFSLFTSGSSGMPKRIFFTEEDLELTADFFAHGMQTMMTAGQTALVLMPGSAPGSVGDLLRRGVARFGAAAVICERWDDDDQARDRIVRTRPDCIVGLPAQLLRLAREGGVPFPKSVLLSADYVPSAVVDGLRAAWGCEVFTHYGMTETGFGGGVECEAHDGYHLRADDLLVEIVDSKTGRPLPAGAWGEVVISTLSRRAMPLLRYRTGDCARLLTHRCGCGSPFPRLDRVQGRLAVLEGPTPDIYALDEVVFRHTQVLGYSVCRGADGLKLTVETHDPELPELLAQEIARVFGLDARPVVCVGTPTRFGVVVKRQVNQEETR